MSGALELGRGSIDLSSYKYNFVQYKLLYERAQIDSYVRTYVQVLYEYVRVRTSLYVRTYRVLVA